MRFPAVTYHRGDVDGPCYDAIDPSAWRLGRVSSGPANVTRTSNRCYRVAKPTDRSRQKRRR